MNQSTHALVVALTSPAQLDQAVALRNQPAHPGTLTRRSR